MQVPGNLISLGDPGGFLELTPSPLRKKKLALVNFKPKAAVEWF